ncbi:MAG: XrtA system polysaccharide deacetylase [Planctomycetaceae bacterium]
MRPSTAPHQSKPDQPPLAAFTVDVEDYFHVSGFADQVPAASWPDRPRRFEVGLNKLLELLDRHQVRGTFFILGWVAEHQPQLVRRIADLGHELGSHSYAHRLVYQQTAEEFRADLRRSRDVIEQATGQRVEIYRAPSFSIVRDSLWALEILVSEGFTMDSSIFPIWHDRYGIPDAETNPCDLRNPMGTIVEFPPTVCELGRLRMPVGGGGYLRIFPELVTRLGLGAVERSGRPFQIYVHPWELDPAQPRLSGRWLSRQRHYRNLDKTEARLERLLSRHRFGTLSDSLNAYRSRLGGAIPEVPVHQLAATGRHQKPAVPPPHSESSARKASR